MAMPRISSGYFLRLAFLKLMLGASVAGSASAGPLHEPASEPKPFFDGRSLDGWEGDAKLWRVEDGAITGGSLESTIAHNAFLCTKASFENVVLRLRLKLTGSDGFINSGVQSRSKRAPDSATSAPQPVRRHLRRSTPHQPGGSGLRIPRACGIRGSQ